MAIQKFEDIVEWQKSQILAVEIYSIFKNSKDYGFRDQICRSVISISSNIAEGFDRSSNADFARFLHIALGSCSETKSLIYLGQNLKYLTDKQTQEILLTANEISKIIRGLIKKLSTTKK
jgi:four helix bundle protein